MEISEGKSIRKGIQLLMSLNDNIFGHILELAIKRTCNETPEFSIQSIASSFATPASHLKQAYATILTVLYHLSKKGTSNSVISTHLNQLGFSDSKSDIMASKLDLLSPFDKILSQTGFSFPMIVDCKWRIFYSIRSSNKGSLDEFQFLITLVVRETDGRLDSIQMTTTLEQLQLLLFKVTAATKQAERLLSSLSQT